MNKSGDRVPPSLSWWAVVVLVLLAGGWMLGHLTGRSGAWLGAFFRIATQGAMACAIVAAAGGWGYLLVRRLAPPSAPAALRVVTACGLGLWMLSTAVLAVGSAVAGALTEWVWWPVVVAGLLLAAWQGRKAGESPPFRRRLDGRALVWVLVALAVGLALAGATRPPGWVGVGGDEYDVLEYHLQVPREFLHNRQIGELPHNVYSHYPLGVEMLFLLAMTLCGGAYEGMYLAKFLHVAFGAIAVAGLFVALKRDEPARGRSAAVLLATTPFVIYLCWLAMVELASICYLALGLLWLREWIVRRHARSALMIGAMLGAACAVKYLSVGLVAGPVLLVMFGLAVVRRKRLAGLGHVMLVGGAAVLLFSPWLIRNAAYTGNPVFPLATGAFGRGHWSVESEQRWVDGHGPQIKPPVPRPPAWKTPPQPDRAEMFYAGFLVSQWFGPILKLLAAAAVCVLIASTGAARPWDWALAGVLAVQLAVWTLWTHAMPGRFLVPAVVPMALLAGGLLARLVKVQRNPFRRKSSRPAFGPWGLIPAAAVLAAAAGVNIFVAYVAYRRATDPLPPVHGSDGSRIAVNDPRWKFAYALRPDCRVLLVGEARGFYFPPGTIYATAFDSHPLARMADRGLGPAEVLAELRRMGVTHVWVHWLEIWRLAGTYGYPASLSAELWGRLRDGKPPALQVLERLPGGARVVEELNWPRRPRPAPETWRPFRFPTHWPLATLYALPGTTHADEQNLPPGADSR